MPEYSNPITVAETTKLPGMNGNTSGYVTVQEVLDLIRNTFGQANGPATLDGNGKLNASQIPEDLDDVLVYGSYALLPAAGEGGKLYITADNNKGYRWASELVTPAYVLLFDPKVGTDLSTLITNLTTGVLIVKKAECDDEGNAIKNTYAKKSGVYEGMTVGNAMQLVSSARLYDEAVYADRTAGGGADIGNKSWLKSVTGVTVNANQLSDIADGYRTLDGNAFSSKYHPFYLNHRYLLIADVSFESEPSYVFPVMLGFFNSARTHYKRKTFLFNSSNHYCWYGKGSSLTTDGTSLDDGESACVTLQMFGGSGNRADYSNVQVFDFTAMFGSAIADLVYTKEQSEAGSGLAWLRSYGFLSKPKYPYSDYTLQSVCLSSHDTDGFNQYDHTTGKAHILANTLYRIKGTYSSLAFADLNGNALSITPDSNGLFTSTVEAILTVTGGNATDTCVYIYYDNSRDDYFEPFKGHSYPMDSNVVLGGILKLDSNNNLVYYGDTYDSDRTVKTNVKSYTFNGTENWRQYSTTDTWYTENISDALISSGVVVSITGGFISRNSNSGGTGNSTYNDKDCWMSSTPPYKRFYIKMASATSESDMQSATTGITVIYPLATPIVNTTDYDPFTEEQIVDNWGTEAFIDGLTRDVFVPPMAETVYTQDLRDKLEAMPSSPENDGLYLMKRENNQNTYVAYTSPIPSAGSEDGMFVLKATVSSGTTTLAWVAEE